MTQLHSYFTYVPVVLIPLAAVGLLVVMLTGSVTIPWYFLLFYLPGFFVWGYILYRMKRVYYEHGELYIGNLFSKKLDVVRKDRFGSIDPRYRIGDYKVTYYDDDNNVKYAYFTLNSFISDGKQIIDKLNEIP